jgi:hypothetical protein
MKSILTKAWLASMVVVLAAGTKASALIGEGSVRADIPFSFYAGNTLLPAGNYTITVPYVDNPDVLLFRNSNNTAEAFVMVNTATRETPTQHVELHFAKVGGRDFLSTIWVAGMRTGYDLMEPSLEKKLQANATTRGQRPSLPGQATTP